MKTKMILAALCLTAMGAYTAAPPPLGDAGGAAPTPGRLGDGRVEPSTLPNPKAYAWKTQEQRIARLEKTNDLRNALLARFPLPLAVAKRVPDGSIKIDGSLSEDAWKQAQVITNLRDKDTGKVVAEQTRFRLLWDSKYLYIGAQCDDSDIIATIKDRKGDLWREDAVEVFINPSGDEMSYLEFEISPLGIWYDASLADYRPEVDWDVNGSHLDMPQTIQRYSTKASKWAAKVNGTVNGGTGTDKGWTAEMAIAWTDIARGANVLHTVPQDGDVWRMNLYRININRTPKAQDVYSAWNPTATWFHRPWSFGRVVFIN